MSDALSVALIVALWVFQIPVLIMALLVGGFQLWAWLKDQSA